jgi:hypothetical protein
MNLTSFCVCLCALFLVLHLNIALFNIRTLVLTTMCTSIIPERIWQVAVNYHKMWHNLPALMAALGLPPHLAATFPKRIETVRGRNASSTTLGVGNGLSATRTALRQMYAPMVKEITANPAVLVV